MSAPFAPGHVIESVAVFPLPRVVLLPGALLPLHVFEPRYRAMTRDTLAHTRLIVVAQIPEDHTVDEFGQPEFCSISGLGEIVHHDVLPDGRFNILVRGHERVQLRELPLEHPYRRARATVVATSSGTVEPATLRALVSTASRFAARVRESHRTFDFKLPHAASPGEVADTCAHHLVLDGARRQRLLETLNDATRVERCLEALMMQQEEMNPGGGIVN